MGGREKDYRNVANELAQLKVDAIVTAGHPAALAAKSATPLIPIIALAVVDPVGSDLAEVGGGDPEWSAVSNENDAHLEIGANTSAQ